MLVIATDALEGVGLVDELGDGRPPEELEVAVVAPAVERSAVKHAAGDLEPARESAERRLAARLSELRRSGVSAFGMLGDSDPLLAAEDSLKSFPAEEVLIFERPGDQSRWFEDGLFERAQEALEPPIRMVTVEAEPQGAEAVAEEHAGGAALINIAHVIALTLFESVRYRGGFRRFFRAVTLAFTPLAALANFVLWLVS